MSALRALAIATVPTAAATTVAAAQTQSGAGDFAGIFDTTAKPTTGSATNPTLSGMAKRGRKAVTDEQAGSDETGSETEDGSRTKGGQGSGVAMPLDIAALAQMVAALTAIAQQPTDVVSSEQASGTAKSAAPSGATSTPTPPISTFGTPEGAAVAASPSRLTETAAGSAASSEGVAAIQSSPPQVGPGGGSAGAPSATAGSAAPQAAPTRNGSARSSSSVGPAGAGAAAETSAASSGDDALLSQDGRMADQGPATVATAATLPGVAQAAAVPSVPSGVATPSASGGATLLPERARLSATPSAQAASSGRAGPGPASVTPTLSDDGGSPATTSGQADGLATVGTSTNLAPADTPVPPAQQVVTALQSLASQPVASAARTSAPSSTTAAGAAQQAAVTTASGVKTLTIQLDPGHLGPVSVTLRMKADAVDIQIAVSNPQALHLLERDRHVLAAAVEAMGGSGASLHLDETDATANGGPNLSNPSFTPQGNASRQDGSSDAASTGRGNGHRSTAPQDTTQSDPDDPTSPTPAAPPRARDGSLYL